MLIKDIFKKFEKLAFNNIYICENDDALFKYLMVWWCNYYKKPKKDPLLLEYTLEELLLEYFEQNLINDKKRLEELKREYIDKFIEMSDEEWIKMQEKEVGKITEANNEITKVEDINDNFTDLLNKKE